jgi:hypothetical protein
MIGPMMIPLNVLDSVTRGFSMFVRLFGNVMSGVFRHWHRRFAGVPLGTDPAYGARSADRAGTGLPFRGVGYGVHHLRGRDLGPLVVRPEPERSATRHLFSVPSCEWRAASRV